VHGLKKYTDENHHQIEHEHLSLLEILSFVWERSSKKLAQEFALTDWSYEDPKATGVRELKKRKKLLSNISLWGERGNEKSEKEDFFWKTM